MATKLTEAGVTISGQDTADDVSEVRDVVHVGESRGDEDVALASLGENILSSRDLFTAPSIFCVTDGDARRPCGIILDIVNRGHCATKVERNADVSGRCSSEIFKKQPLDSIYYHEIVV
jgi:hypothetical protein